MDDVVAAGAVRRQRSLQQRAVEQLRALAKPYRLRVQVDAEGFPFIPGRYGQIEWHCDGVNCWSCALPGQLALVIKARRRRSLSAAEARRRGFKPTHGATSEP